MYFSLWNYFREAKDLQTLKSIKASCWDVLDVENHLKNCWMWNVCFILEVCCDVHCITIKVCYQATVSCVFNFHISNEKKTTNTNRFRFTFYLHKKHMWKQLTIFIESIINIHSNNSPKRNIFTDIKKTWVHMQALMSQCNPGWFLLCRFHPGWS